MAFVRLICAVALVAGMSSALRAQETVLSDTALAVRLERALRWMSTGSYHVARRELKPLLDEPTSPEAYRDILLLAVKSDYEDKEYAEAYERAVEFLHKYPGDPAGNEVTFIQGVSAFHSRHSKAAVQAFTAYLATPGAPGKTSEALYWRAMSRLDLGEQTEAQADLERCMNEPSAGVPRDVTLMGFALSMERKQEFAQAADKLEQLLAEFPNSRLRSDAQIRLASVSLRLNRTRHALDVLESTTPGSTSQREEYLLLRAEAEFRLGQYTEAAAGYRTFVRDYDDSPHLRKAWYGLAWSLLKGGDSHGARIEFDSLSSGTDTIAYASMYHSGVLALLDGDAAFALARFDTLVAKSPYDRYLDEAYYQIGLIHYRSKFYKEARHNFQLCARLYPESPRNLDAFHMMGQSSMAMSDFSNAQYGFAQVRKLNGSGTLLANAMFQEGVALYHLGRFRTCTERFGDFLKQFPREPRAPDAMVWRGEAMYQDGKFDEAERSYADALKLLTDSPKREDAMYGLAWTLFEQKKFSQAASAFDRYATSYPGGSRVLEASLRKADCYFFLGQYDKSSALYEELAAAKTESKNIEYAAFQLAMSYIQRGETERGIQHLREFLVKYPESIYAEVVQFNIGWTYFSREAYPSAITEFHALEYRYPESQLMPRVLFNTGDAFFNLKSYDSALVYYLRVIREYPSSPLSADALAGVQYTYVAQGKPQSALAEIDSVLGKKHEGISIEELLVRKGDILFGQGDFDGAARQYQQLLATNPPKGVQAKTYYQLGRTYELQNDPNRAVKSYEAGLKADPASDVAASTVLALGMAQIKSGQYAAAVKSLEGFDERYPESPLSTEVHFQLGGALVGVPDPRRAIAEYQTVIRTSPDNIFADRSRLQIARIHQSRKEFAASTDTLNALVAKRSDDVAAEALLMIGENYAAQKKYREALQSYNDIIQQYTDYPLQVEKARFGLGETYEKMKDKKQARAQYQEIVKAPVDPKKKSEAEQRLKKLK